MPRFLPVLLTASALLLESASAGAQVIPGFKKTLSDTRVEISRTRYQLVGNVELESGDTKIFADEAELFVDEDRAVATGNVVFMQGTNQISSDRAEFNVKTRLGTFYNATGMASFQPPRQTTRSGGVAPPMTGQNTDVYFFGETIEKIGPKKYKITKGGFTSCVQPTPRWNLNADTVTLNIDHYTLLRQAVLNVKGVPMFYLPFLYYPTKKDQRATGFLLPTYGSSTLRGQQFHNGFFWAIDRSQDATIMHEFYSRIGQGVSGEYRYNFGGGSDGQLTAHMLDQHEATYTLDTGQVSTQPALRSYELRGGSNQMLPGNLRARASVNYFSSITTNQTFNTNVLDASRNNRHYGANVVGGWYGYTLNGTFDRSEYFYSTASSGVTGGAPRVAFSKSERPLWGSPVYFSVGSEYVYLLSEAKSGNTIDKKNLTRVDFTPQIRFPFKQWQWFTVNSSLNWRDTYYTRSLDGNNKVVAEGLNRRFFTAQAQIVGPIFNRFFDTPDNRYAEKFKHTIEPFLTLQRTSSIDNADRIVYIEGIDRIVGGTTQYAYGVNNRFYAKRRQTPGQPSSAREIISVGLTQTYYTNEQAALYDTRYATSFSDAPPSHFSPIQLSVRAMPSNDVSTTLSAEFDSRYHSLRTISLTESYSWTNRMQSSVTWSKRFLIPKLKGFDDATRLDHYFITSTNVHTQDNRLGVQYSVNYDVLRSTMLQQRVSGFYNAQCCGLAVEYQSYNFSGLVGVPIPADHRFFLSFTLAGLGNFSPFNGALGGVPR
jgi:LPS-assembly protein